MARLHRTPFIVVGAVVALAALGHSVGVTAPLELGIVSGMRPLQKYFYTSALDATNAVTCGTSHQDENKLLIENSNLKDEIQKLLAQQHQSTYLAGVSLSGIASSVIGKSSEGDYLTLTIDRGTESNVAVNQAVITDDGIFVGKIIETAMGRSIVTVATNIDLALAAEIDNTTRSPGIVSGDLGLAMKMSLIPSTESVEKGQMVVTSSLDEYIPPNLIIGEIVDVQKQVGELFQTASLETLVDFRRIRFVTIIQQ